LGARIFGADFRPTLQPPNYSNAALGRSLYRWGPGSHETVRTIPKRCGTPTREGRYPQRGQFECEQSDSGLSAEVNEVMDSIIYLVGLIVVVMFILGALGLH
jgi:hypothetical protein